MLEHSSARTHSVLLAKTPSPPAHLQLKRGLHRQRHLQWRTGLLDCPWRQALHVLECLELAHGLMTDGWGGVGMGWGGRGRARREWDARGPA